MVCHIKLNIFWQQNFKIGLTIIFSFFLILRSNSQVTFQQTFQAPYMNGGTYVDITNDGGFIVTGQHQSSGAGGCDFYIFRRDVCGNLVWFNTYGGSAEDGGMCIRPTLDGGFIVSGLSQTGAGGYDAALMKIDGNGAVQWFKDFGGPGDDRGLQVQETSDGGYIMSGNTSSFGAGGWDAYLIKTDNLGNMIWSRTYGGGGTDYGNYVEQTDDGGYIIMGSTNSFGSGGWDLWMLKLDSTGLVQWNKTYGGIGNEGEHWHTKGTITSDGGYAISSYTSSFGAGSNDFILIKTDTAGVVQWAKSYGGAGDDQHRFMRECRDKGFILTGYSTSFGFGGNDYYLLKTDSAGILEWSYVYGGAGAEKAMCVQQANDNGFVMSGNATSFSPPGPGDLYDAYIVKTDSVGIVGCNQDTAATIVNSISPSVTIPAPSVLSGATQTNVNPTVIPYTPAPQVLCLDCDLSFAKFKYCDNGLKVDFIDSSICATGWLWDFGDGNSSTTQNPSHTYANPGTYLATLVALNVSYGCDDTLTIPITLDTFSIADFSIQNVCLGDSAYFLDESDTTLGNILGWFWVFGDGDTSLLQSPSHFYLNPGIYTVSLTVLLEKDNCTDTIKKVISVHPRPIPDFITDTACALGPSTFTDSTNLLSGILTSWQWDFDDSFSSTIQNPFHTYALGGIYNVKMITTSDSGCTDSITKSVKVHYTPSSNFIAPPVCFEQSMAFSDASLISTDTIVSWLWDFGDTNTSTLINPSNNYAAAGLYTVVLTIVSNNGCLDSISQIVVVNPKPAPLFLSGNTCLYDSAIITDQSTIVSGAITNWTWDFGDGNTSTLSNPNHLYTSDGSYNIFLTLISDSGCIDTLSKTIIVHPVPSPVFSAIDVCAYDSTYFIDQSSITGGNVSGWSWTFDDGYISSEQNPVHFYGMPGTFNVQLVAISDSSCSDTINQTYNVFNIPDADYSFSTVCINEPPTSFSDLSTVTNDIINFWQWDFDDGNLSTMQNPSNAYTDSGLYSVELSVITANNCKDTIVHLVEVFPIPLVSFDSDTAIGCAPLTVNFTNSSSNSISYFWDLGNGSSTSLDEPIYTFPDPGAFTSYTVSLTATSSDGCVNTLTKIDTIVILPNPIASFTIEPNPATLLHPYITFTNISSGNLDEPVTYTWDFGDGASWTGFDTNHTYSNIDTGTYMVKLIVSNAHNCKDTVTTVLIIEDDFTIFIPSAFTPNNDGFNDTFFPKGIGIYSENFKFHFYIYDRWGDLVFETDDPMKHWDGRVNNGVKISQQDIFVWIIQTEDNSGKVGKKHQYIGHVTLIH